MRQVRCIRKSSLRLASTGIALALAAGAAALANGTVDTADSVISAGAAPQQGAVATDPCAPPGPAPAMPSIGAVGTLGSMTGSVAAFQGGGGGSNGACHITASGSRPGGTYEFTSYVIDPGVVVRYQSPVVIRTTGDVVIDGQVIDDQGGATFECAGDMSVRANIDAAAVGIVTTGGGLMRLDVAGALRIIDISQAPSESTSAFQAQGDGDIEFVARGGSAAAPMEIRNALVAALHVDVESATGLVVYGGSGISTSYVDGGVALRAFGGDVDVQRTTVYSYGPLSVEASGALRGEYADFRSWAPADLRLTAFGGPLTLTSFSYLFTPEGGDIRCRAAGDVQLSGGCQAENFGDGTMEMTAFGGDLKLVGGNTLKNDGVGPVTLAASGALSMDTSATVAATHGDLTLRAFGGALTCSGTISIQTALGAVDVGASGDVTATAAGDVRFEGESLAFVGDRIDLAAALASDVGAVSLTARGALAGKGVLAGAGGFTATSISGDVTFDDATIMTADAVGARSGDVRIETYGGATSARIAARRASISTGSSDTASGDVTIRVVTVPRPTVARYLLPNNVALKLGGKHPGLRADGTISCASAWLAPGDPVPFVFDVGSREISGELTQRSSAGDREYKAAGVLLRVSPSKTGTSKGVFSLRLDEDLTGLVPADGLVDFRLSLDGTDFLGTVRLTAGKFKLGTTRGAVSELLYPLAVVAQAKGGGKDSLSLTVGFASDATTPDAAPDLGLDFGDGWSVKIDAADFVRSGDRFVAKNPPSAAGLTLVSVDYDKETVTVKGKNLDLGGVPAESPVSVRIGVGFGGDLRSVDVVLSRKGTKLAY